MIVFIVCVTVCDVTLQGVLGVWMSWGCSPRALGTGPWRVTRSVFDAEAAQLDLYLDFDRGVRFACRVKDCAYGGCPVHDTADKTWRHLDFFQHKAFLHARLAAGALPAARGAAGERALGAPGVRVHAVVRGAGAQLRRGEADVVSRRDDPGARHQDLADRGAPRARRPRPARLHRGAPGRNG